MRIRLAGLCLLAAAVAPAHAVNVDARGTGQVLIYPYYTVNAGLQTIFSLVNTSGRAKIVQVNFREGYNGRLTLRFDLILGARDTWTGVVFESPRDGLAHVGRRDDSCTVPLASLWSNPGTSDGGPSQVMYPFDYTGNNADGGPIASTRMREGYFEFVERAELDGELGTAANEHRCGRFENLAAVGASQAIRPPGGGLRGSFAIVNVAQGTILGGNATAIDGFSTTPLFAAGQNPILFDAFAAPNGDGTGVTARVPVGGKLVDVTYPANRRVDAISAVLMADTLLGDVTHEAGVGSNTDWIVTAPTKRFHTDADRALTQLAPFAESFGTTQPGRSCVGFDASLHDRLGRPVALTRDIDFTIASGSGPMFALCHATDVLSFSSGATEAGTPVLATPVLGSVFGIHLGDPTPPTDAGSLELVLGYRGDARTALPPGSSGPGLRGLPVIGVEAVSYINANALPGVLAHYTLARPLSTTASCTNAAGAVGTCP